MKEKDPFFLDENFGDDRQIQTDSNGRKEQQRREKRDEKRRILSTKISLDFFFFSSSLKSTQSPFFEGKQKKKERRRKTILMGETNRIEKRDMRDNFFCFCFSIKREVLEQNPHKSTRFIATKKFFLQTRVIIIN